MSLSAATVTFGPEGPALSAGPSLPVEALVLGRPVAEVADLLPRLFNLCRAAQGTAARLALGLPATADPVAEVVRDHRLRLCVILPRAFGLPPIPLSPGGGAGLPDQPDAPQDGVARLAADLIPGGLPDDIADLAGPLAPLARAIAAAFPPGTAGCAALPDPPSPLAEGAFENSPAGRQSHHPLLRRIERSHGRGPLWRFAGLLADLEAAQAHRLPPPCVTDGTATAPAARGSYAVRITQAGGVVTRITRRTPTDHLLAPGGALLQALAGLPAPLRHLAPQVIALHDPCIPVTLREAEHA